MAKQWWIETLTVGREEEGDGAWCDGTPVIATPAIGAEASQHQLPIQFQISLPYLGACWEKEVPVINSYIRQENCNKQLSQNECPEKDQGEPFGEGQD